MAFCSHENFSTARLKKEQTGNAKGQSVLSVSTHHPKSTDDEKYVASDHQRNPGRYFRGNSFSSGSFTAGLHASIGNQGHSLSPSERKHLSAVRRYKRGVMSACSGSWLTTYQTGSAETSESRHRMSSDTLDDAEALRVL